MRISLPAALICLGVCLPQPNQGLNAQPEGDPNVVAFMAGDPQRESTRHVRGEWDKCGEIDEKILEERRLQSGDGWGYDYDQLLDDLDEWRQSPYVAIHSIGQSVQGRYIWELTVTSNEIQTYPRKRITIHARTHPHEIQSWWVCDEIIQFLLSEDPTARLIRQYCTVHIIPMYNPDGVELETTRYNANGVDLEREWDKFAPEPEAAALKARFLELMYSDEPIELALNLHSSSDPERYFWFHDETGTSPVFADLERTFIGFVRDWFARIMPWDYAVSWKGTAPRHFPESWFWFNFGTDVMALTYEDVFSHTLETPDADFDSAARALLHGAVEYLGLNTLHISPQPAQSEMEVSMRNGRVVVHGVSGAEEVAILIYDLAGRSVYNSGRHPVTGRGPTSIPAPINDIPSGPLIVRCHSYAASNSSFADVIQLNR